MSHFDIILIKFDILIFHKAFETIFNSIDFTNLVIELQTINQLKIINSK